MQRQRMKKAKQIEKVVVKLAQFHKEIQKPFDKDGVPMVYQIGDTTVIGEETVRKTDIGFVTGYYPTNKKRYFPESDTFQYYESAVSFSIARQRGLTKLAREIPLYDKLVYKYQFDQANYIRLLRVALKKRDVFTAELYKLRLEESMRHHRHSREQLDQLCFRAKYKHNTSG